jgi:hypothetical protein
MGFWKTISGFLFGGRPPASKGLVFYVRLHKLPNRQSPDDEIIAIRIHPHNDLSLNDDGQYFVRKVAVGPKTFRRAEVMLTFDKGRKLIDSEVDGGELVEEEDYEAYLEQIGEDHNG